MNGTQFSAANFTSCTHFRLPPPPPQLDDFSPSGRCRASEVKRSSAPSSPLRNFPKVKEWRHKRSFKSWPDEGLASRPGGSLARSLVFSALHCHRAFPGAQQVQLVCRQI